MKRKFYFLINLGFMLAIFASVFTLNAQNQATKLDANRTVPDCECTITIVDLADYELDCNEAWPEFLTTDWAGAGADCEGASGTVDSDGGVDGETVRCTQSRVYTFTVTDVCEKVWTETTTVYRVVDTEKPTISNCPDEVDLGCNPDPSEYEPSLVPDWSDNCEIFETGVRQGEVVDMGGCGYMMITHEYYAIDGCDNEATCDQVFTWKLDDVPPELSNLPDGGYMGCNPDVLPSCDQGVTATDNCDGDLEVVCTPGDITGDDCNKTQVFNYYAIDECGNDISVDVTYTWKIDLTDPILSNVPSGGDLGCNPAELPTCDQNVTATDNCDGDLEVNCAPGEITGDCEKTQTFTYSAVDACGNDVSAEVIYTWKEDTEYPTLIGVPDDITLNCNEEIPSPAEVSAEDNCPGLNLSFVQNTNEGDCENESTITRTWTATDACGNETTDDQVITIVDDLDPEITCPEDLYLACEDDIPAPGTATATDNCDEDVFVEYLGEVQNGNPPDAYTITRTWGAVDNCQNSVTCDQVIYVEACEESEENCTLTQGYYGNEGGLFCDEMTTTELLDYLLQDELVIGVSGSGSLTVGVEESDFVLMMLPGGGKSKVLTKDYDSENYKTLKPYIYKKKKYTLNNTLLAQTLTLGLNLRIDGSTLSGLPITSMDLEVYNITECGGEAIGDPIYYDLTESVFNELVAKYGNPTVGDLLEMANLSLADEYVPALYQPSLSDISDAVTTINEAFDECRIGSFLPPGDRSSEALTGIIDTESDVNIKAYPNPFMNDVTIEFTLAEDTDVVLEVYNLTGAKVATLYDGSVQANQNYSFNFSGVTHVKQETFIYVLRTGKTVKMGRLVMIK